MPLLYRTFADLKDLIELPLGLRKGLNYDIVAGCSNFNPSSDDRLVELCKEASQRAASDDSYIPNLV